MKWFESISFLEQYGISAQTNGLGISKKSVGIMQSSCVLSLHFSLNSSMTLFTNLVGKSGFKIFCLIVGIFSVKVLAICAV